VGAVFLLMSVSSTCLAESPSAAGKGITGGALLGAEAVLITEALLGVKSSWILLGSGALGAAGGGFGGYYVEGAASPKVSFYLLVGGMALLIPSAIVYADATANPVQDEVFTDPAAEQYDDELEADPPEPGEDSLSQDQRRPRYPSLISVSTAGASVGFPGLEVAHVYSPDEVREFGVTQATQFIFPLLRSDF
jgi:hypothetical protein